MRTSELCKHCGGACCLNDAWIFLRWLFDNPFNEKKRDEVFENLKKELLENLEKFEINPSKEQIEECLSIVKKHFQKEHYWAHHIESPCCIFLSEKGCLIPENRPQM
ncbi:MAG: hypothetical protein ACXQS8_08715, partial [Candidatus Helarchaeales archaeon]